MGILAGLLTLKRWTFASADLFEAPRGAAPFPASHLNLVVNLNGPAFLIVTHWERQLAILYSGKAIFLILSQMAICLTE